MKKLHVLQSAVRLFAHQGFGATGIRELGAAAGLNSATLYHYAGGDGKEGILSAIMRTCLEQLLVGGRASIAQSADPMIQLAYLVASHVGICALNPLTAQVTDQEIRALSPANHAALVGLRDDYESLFSMLLERGIRTGAFVVVDSQITRLALLEMCNGVAHWFQPGGRLTVEQVQQHFIVLACRLTGCGPLPEDFFDINTLMPAIQLDVEPPFDLQKRKESDH